MSIVLLLAALGGICVLLWNCAVYAVPVCIGLWVGFQAIGWGAGMGSVLIGLVAGVAIYFVAETVLMIVRWAPLRLAVLAAFAVPAGAAAYFTVMQFAEIGLVPSIAWRHVLAAAAAIIVACISWARLRDSSQMRTRYSLEPMRFRPTANVGR